MNKVYAVVSLLAAAVMAGEGVKKDFPLLQIKKLDGSFSVFTSISWEGNKKTPQNATAYFSITEYGKSGRVELNRVSLFMSPQDLRDMHSLLGAMVKEIDGKNRKQ